MHTRTWLLLSAAVLLAGCTDSLDSDDVERGPALLCDEGKLFLDHTPKATVTHGENVSFTYDARVEGQLGAVWLLEDRRVAGEEATHAFATPGDHEVELRVFTEEGCVVRATYGVEIVNRDPVAGFKTTVLDDSLVLDGRESQDPNGDELTFEWTVDGTYAADGAQAVIPLPEDGAVVGLIVRDAYGAEDRDQQVFQS